MSIRFAVARTATRNPDINGRTLYWTRVGLWTLDPRNARTFEKQSEAAEMCVKDLEGCRVEEIAL